MLLGIDLGTSSVKTLLLREDGQVVADGSSSYAVHSPEAGWAESDPEAWWQAVCEAVREVTAEHAKDVTAIGLSGQMHGVVLCDAVAHPLRPAILWADTRSSSQCDRYLQLPERLLKTLANPPAVGMAGPSLLWLKDNEVKVYETARWAFQPKDWLRFKLTAQANADPSDASATLLYDFKTDTWSSELANALGLRSDWLAPVLPSAYMAGELTKDAAHVLGLQVGIPIATGSADAAASALGGGLIQAEKVQINIGTAMQIFAIRDEAVADEHRRTHLYRSALDNWYAMAAMQNAGLALEWVRHILTMSWDEMYHEAFALPAGCEGVSFLPYLTGERTPHFDAQARGLWFGLDLRHERGHLARAAFEGVSFALKDGLNALKDVGINVNTLRLSGGGTFHPEWRQLLADVLEHPLDAVAVSDASARGAALLAGLATGVYHSAEETLALSPLPQRVAHPQDNPALADAFERFKQLYQTVSSPLNKGGDG